MPTAAISQAAVLLGVAETTIGQVPVGAEWNISTIRFCNVSNNPRQVTIYNYNTVGEAAGDTTTEYKQFSIQGKSTFEYGPVIITANRKISALADAANVVSARIHGWETTP